jgi:hypothetical protein
MREEWEKLKSRAAVPQNIPDPSWYSRYWLEDEPWPDLAFVIGRLVRRVARVGILAIHISAVRFSQSVRDIGLSGKRGPAGCGAQPGQSAKHPA